MTWQPIETAPRDGTRILLFQPEEISRGRVLHRAVLGHWVACAHSGWVSDGLQHAEPTHWMPLPEAPADEEDERERVYRLFGQLRRGEP